MASWIPWHKNFTIVSPDTFVKILNIYAVSFYGSGLWNLFSADCERLYSAWNVAIWHAWNIPNTTHRYLVESISGSLHPKVMLASRYSSFANSLMKSPKYPVRVLASLCASDHRTVMGQSLSHIGRECGLAGCDLSLLTSRMIKEKMKYFPVPPQESWRIGFLSELLNSNLEIPGFNTDEVDEMVSHLCKS